MVDHSVLWGHVVILQWKKQMLLQNVLGELFSEEMVILILL